MTEFKKSNWSVENFSGEYLKKADLRMPQRLTLYETALSYYNFFFNNSKIDQNELKIVDLGCGDGFLVELLSKITPNASFMLIDGSESMISESKGRLSNLSNVEYAVMTLEDATEFDFGEVDFFVSSLAIHHMTTDYKSKLFKNIYEHLKSGGSFLNLDVVSLDNDEQFIEHWYLKVWEEEIHKNQKTLNIEGDFMEFIKGHEREDHYRNLDTLESQLNALKDAGFKSVNCHYKKGTFTVYGGTKS